MCWKNIFEIEHRKNMGLTQQEIEIFLKEWHKTINQKYILGINYNENYFLSNSSLPEIKFPKSYIDFLKYSNGGEFQTGDRYFQFFSLDELIEFHIEYNFPRYMKYALSFAMDGCGNHYVFDMRKPMYQDEYPILIVSSGNLGYEDSKFIEHSFIDVCKGTTSIDKLLYS